MRRLGLISLLLITPFLAFAESSQHLEPISLHFSDRAPYAISGASGAEPSGVVAVPAAVVFRKAGIPFVWEKTPVNRQFAIMKENRGRNCAIGFEKTSQREVFANFTEPLYISQPFIAITSLKVKEKSGVSLKYMLSKYSIIVKENYTQGAALTQEISNSSKKYVTSVGSEEMVQMVARGRADFMLISNDELEYYVQHKIIESRSIRVLKLTDVNLRFARRIMCNKGVEPEVIEKLNRAIATLHVRPTPYKSVVKP